VTIRHRVSALTGAAAAAVLAAAPLQAATIYWQGGSGNLISANYNDGTTSNLTPTAGDVINFGAGGTATHSVPGPLALQKLRVGHNQATPGGTGTGVVTINNGAAVALTDGTSGAANAALWVGNVQNGTLNIDGPNTSVTSSRLIVVGYGNNVSRNGTINITNGASLTATLGNILLGERAMTNQNGVQGHMFVNGNLTAAEAAADLIVGVRGATSTFTQTGGLVQIGDAIEVGADASTNSSFTISGGTTTHGGNFVLGSGTTVGATLNISGSGVVNTGNRFLMGSGSATGVTVNHSGGVLNTVLDVRVGDTGTADSTYNLSGAGVINSTTGGVVGRQGTGKLLQTGGVANFGGVLSIGNRETAANTAAGLYKISGGDLNVATALNVAPKGTGELRIVGDDATIDLAGNFSVSNTVDGVGTLAYELEAGDLLSVIDVIGTATFNSGAALVFDTTNASPTQNVYDLLTAADIVDSGIAFSGPANWNYRIVAGGRGEILQAFAIPEPASFGMILVAATALLRRRR
jgi:hypothetical protein